MTSLLAKVPFTGMARCGLMAPVVAILASGIAADRPAFRPLFDGGSLAGWTSIGGKPGNWRAEGGRLATQGDGKGWLSTNRAYGDFELSLEYQIGPAGNSGVLIRAPHRGDPSFDGLEVQILDDEAPSYRDLQPAQYTGSIYGLMAATRGHARPPGEWNALLIRAEGSKIRVELNGFPVVDGDLAKLQGVPTRHRRGVGRPSGFVGLQSHSTPAEFRNLTIRELPGS